MRSYGTEGREKTDPSTTFVAPQDSVHPYLLFRGCDIKDLHVHENASQPAPSDPAIVSSSAPPDASKTEAGAQSEAQQSKGGEKQQTADSSQQPPLRQQNDQSDVASGNEKNKKEQQKENQEQRQNKQGGRGAGGNRRPRKPNPAHQVGTGASLLTRKARGTVDGGKLRKHCEYVACGCWCGVESLHGN